MESSLTNNEVILPTSKQIEDFYRRSFKGRITLAVNREAGNGESFFPVDAKGCISLIVAIRKNESEPFRNPWTGERVIPSNEKYDDYKKYREDMFGSGGIFCLLKVEDFVKEYLSCVNLPQRKHGENVFCYIDRALQDLFYRIDIWLQENIVLTLSDVRDSQDRYELSVSMNGHMRKPSSMIDFKTLRSGMSIIGPSDDHQDHTLLRAAHIYEKRISDSAVKEISTAYAGCVNVDLYKKTIEGEYLQVLRSASPGFKEFWRSL